MNWMQLIGWVLVAKSEYWSPDNDDSNNGGGQGNG